MKPPLLTRFSRRNAGLLRNCRRVGLTTLVAFSAFGLILGNLPVRAQTCVNSGAGFASGGPRKDGSPTTPLTGIVNVYYGPSGTVTTTAGTTTTITLNAARTLDATLDGTLFSGFAAGYSDITPGDMVLVIQMQDADINSANNINQYGDGGGGNTGFGFTALNRSGQYEFARVTAAAANISTAGGTITLSSALINSYRQDTANQRRFQVIKVPQFYSAGVGTGLTCARWNGSTGGVLAIDAQNDLSFTTFANTTCPRTQTNGTIDVSGRGFRGGAGIRRSGTGTGFTGYANNDATISSNGVVALGSTPLGSHGSKGEGIAGTPRYTTTMQLQAAAAAYGHLTDSGSEGYPGGSYARGGPGNAGGGATDNEGNVASSGGNGQNAGGGGGSNCGAGGVGGNNWTGTAGATSGNDIGGRGGASLSGQYITSGNLTRLFLGGGGGAGSVNNGKDQTDTNADGNAADAITTSPTTRDGRWSSGAPGGGIVILRAGFIVGVGTISANGSNGASAGADGGGGGGAGGTIALISGNVSDVTNPCSGGGIATALTLSATGGNGGNAFLNDANTAGRGHGPGGGGGGGAVFVNTALTSRIGTPTLTGGSPGNTRAGNPGVSSNYGATTGGAGTCNVTNLARTNIPGLSSGGECIVPTEAHVTEFSAVSYTDGGIGLTWKTGFEADNLGFRVWREVNGKRELVTGDGLVAGNALMAGTTLTAGNRYAWRDGAVTRGKVAGTVAYWLEDIDLNGKSSWNGPFELKTSKQPMPESLRNAPLLGRNNPVFGSQTVKSLASADPMELNRYLAESSAIRTSAKSATTNSFQQTLAAGPAVKLGVRTTGWQSISRSSLVSAGLNPAAVDANLRMYVNGNEVPIRVSANSVEFFGVAADTLQSGEQTYWLVEGTSAGLRVPVLPVTGGSKVGVINFPSLVERRDRTVYFAALQNGDADNFFGAVVTNSAVDQAVTLKNRDAGAAFPAQVAVTLQGVSLNSHRVSVKFNGQTIGEVSYANRDQQTFTTTVAQSQILEGQNTVTLQSSDSGDVNLVAAIRVSYARSLVADADALSLSGRAGQTMTVRGFSQTPRVFDVTDPANPTEVFVRADGAGTGSVAASFVAPGAAGSTRQLLAVTASRFLTPTVTANTPSTLSATSNQADFVIITTPEFASALTPLVQLRQSQGLTVKVVDIADVYDEFSFGVKSAQAVKDFLNLASHNWQTPVRYAMFAGNASFDPRDFLGFNQDVIPTKLLGLGSLETASDDWFGDFDDAGLSQVAIGRLPARSTTEITAMVNKIVAYDQANGQAWQREALVVADNNDDGGNFEAAADGVEATLPTSFVRTSVRVGQVGGGTARTQILSALNDGKGFVNYLGHGSVSNWAGENLLTSDDVANLTNTTRPSMVVSMTCLNGFFDVYLENLGASLVRANGRGAAGVWASSSLTISPEQAIVNRALLQSLYNGPTPVRFGDAIRQAKASTNDSTIRKSFILFGDPTARIQ